MIGHRLFLIGDDVVAIQPEDRHVRHPLAQALRNTPHWLDVVPGKEVVAVRFDPMSLLPSQAIRIVEDWLKGFELQTGSTHGILDLHLDVSPEYAPDLETLARDNRLSSKAFLNRLVCSELVVDMLGFTPGFAYVEGVDTSLQAQRLDLPRQRVMAGSVGMVSGQLGLYGLSGPGGWPIIGRLRETLFDPARDEPFLLKEGQKLRLHLVLD